MLFSPQLIFISLAVFYAIMGLPAIVAPQKFKRIFMDLINSTSNLRLLSMFTLLFAFLLFSVNWKISFSIPGLIAILAWIILAKSIMNLYFPKFTTKMARLVLKSTMTIASVGIICLILAGIFAYIGYALV